MGLDSGAVAKEEIARLLEFYQEGQGKPGMVACDCNSSSPVRGRGRKIENLRRLSRATQ